MTTTAAHEAHEAAFRESVLAEWRDWRAYLRAQQMLIQARRRDADDPFETTDLSQSETQAQQIMTQLPPTRRAFFQSSYEKRRQTIGQAMDAERRQHGLRGGTDPDDIDSATIAHLLDECEGRSTTDGRGIVPREDDEAWSLDVAELLERPDATAYTIKGAVPARQKVVMVAGMVGLLLLVCVVGWMLLGRGGAVGIAASPQDLQVNGRIVTPVGFAFIQVGEDAPIALQRVSAAQEWPPSGATAAIRDDMTYPVLGCLPGTLLETAQTFTLIGRGDSPDRRYVVRAPGVTAGADLLLVPCDGRGQARAGMLQAVLPVPAMRIGESVVVLTDPDPVTITVDAVDIVGAGHDGTLPLGAARVHVTVQTDQEIDWPTLAPGLVLPSGEELRPSATDPRLDGTGVVLRYRMSAPTTPMDVAFQVTWNGTVSRWRTTLSPPPARLDVLRQGLTTAVVASLTPGAGRASVLSMTLTLQHTLPDAVTLTMDEVTLMQGTTPLTVPDLADLLREPIEPGEIRRMALEVSLDNHDSFAPLTLTVGAQRFTLAGDSDDDPES